MYPQLFIYSVKEASRPRVSGGLNYEISVYEVINGKAEHIGDRKACTHAHKGEDSEAWAVVIESKRLRPSILKRMRAEKSPHRNPFSYYGWSYTVDYNVRLQRV